jgi:hypothetical protein
MTRSYGAGPVALASCKSRLQSAAVLQLDLSKLMCYTIKAIREEGSGLRGKLATDDPGSVGSDKYETVGVFVMAGLPRIGKNVETSGMTHSCHSAFLCRGGLM